MTTRSLLLFPHPRGCLLVALMLSLAAPGLRAQSPSLSLDFEGVTAAGVPNLGTAGGPPIPLGGFTTSGLGLAGSSALTGSSGRSTRLVLPLDSARLNAPWTLAFALNTSASTTRSGNGPAFQYLFGSSDPNLDLRLLCGSFADPSALVLRGASGGLPELLLPGGAGAAGFVHVAFVHDPLRRELRAYRDGLRISAVALPTPLRFPGGAALWLGGSAAAPDALARGDRIDAFTWHPAALDDLAINSLASGLGAPFGPSPGVAAAWQRNQPSAGLSLDGRAATAIGPALGRILPDRDPDRILGITGLAGAPFELAYTLGAAAVPLRTSGFAVGPQTPSPQTVNLDPGASGSAAISFSSAFSFASPLVPTSVPLRLPSPSLVAAQLLVLDPAQPLGIALSGAVQVETRAGPSASVEVLVDAYGNSSFNADAQLGFFSVSVLPGAAVAITRVTFDAASAAPGTPADGLRFDTDQEAMADRFDGGDSALSGNLGTYRVGSAQATGLLFDGTNTPTRSLLDPNADTGFRASNPGSAPGDFSTLQFRFAAGAFTAGERFEFDCDTDGGRGSTGADMAGMIVRVELQLPGGGLVTRQGSLALDPSWPQRAFLEL